MRPVIGITPVSDGDKYRIKHDYCGAVIKSGGTPVILPYDIQNIGELLLSVDAVLLSGGGDVHARFYNEELHGLAKDVDEVRDEFEIALCNGALKLNKPLLCICRGMQVLNVAAGGTLIQHIAGHSQKQERHMATQEIVIKKNTPLYNIFKKNRIMVNSLHHQALLHLGDCIEPCAESSDGIIKAIYCRDVKFALGVQWHPEAMIEDEEQQKIFDRFIKACSRTNS